MNRTQETRKTDLRPQRLERLMLTIDFPTLDLTHATECWQTAQQVAWVAS